MNKQLRLSPDFRYDLDEIQTAANEVRNAALTLAASEVEFVAQIGTPFATVHGWRGGCQLEESIERAIGLPFEMMGLSLVRACRDLGVETVAVCTVYYARDWMDSHTAFLDEAGIKALYSGSFSELGILEQITMLESCRGHDLCGKEALIETVRRCGKKAPTAQAVLDFVSELETLTGRPVFSYPALYARVLKRLGLPGDAAYGRVFETAA